MIGRIWMWRVRLENDAECRLFLSLNLNNEIISQDKSKNKSLACKCERTHFSPVPTRHLHCVCTQWQECVGCDEGGSKSDKQTKRKIQKRIGNTQTTIDWSHTPNPPLDPINAHIFHLDTNFMRFFSSNFAIVSSKFLMLCGEKKSR